MFVAKYGSTMQPPVEIYNFPPHYYNFKLLNEILQRLPSKLHSKVVPQLSEYSEAY